MTNIKLYTEEQVIEAINKARILSDWWEIEYQYENNDIIESLTPIELPSDEEIEEKIDESAYSIEYDYGFRMGAKWVIEQIKQKSYENTIM